MKIQIDNVAGEFREDMITEDITFLGLMRKADVVTVNGLVVKSRWVEPPFRAVLDGGKIVAVIR